MIKFAWLVPFFPLLGALISALAARLLKHLAHWPVIISIVLAFLTSLALLPEVGPEVVGHHAAAVESGASPAATPEHEAAPRTSTTIVYHWLQLGSEREGELHGEKIKIYNLDIPIEFRVDGLTVMMLMMVTFVAALVAIFAGGYMAGDPGYARFFACVGLFVFSMTGLVLSSNYVLTYAFWEGVGVCSYLLIGFWYAKPSAAAAAKKAFLVNRIGDFGFAIALFWLWTAVDNNDLSYDNVLGETNLRLMAYEAKLGISLLLFWAATAKSAQLPLYVWLPDAMEGPTPVSALIHAATMVTAGVYLIARSSALIFSVHLVSPLIVTIGCATALLSAAIALTQNDLKRVLAYSTISQLGYMFMALGAGVGEVMFMAVVAAMFHLFTHAFFKALLFLGSGSVMHSMGGVIDMRRFRGLRRRMPITCWTFAVGGLALAGIFPMAGFWSKDEILTALKLAAATSDEPTGPGWGVLYLVVYWIAVFTAFLTAFYTGRAFFRTFFGPEKLPSSDDPEADPSEHAGHGHSHGDDHGGHDSHFGHESPPIMWIPLVVLAGCTVLVGILFGAPTGWFENLIARTPSFSRLETLSHAHGVDWGSVGIGTLAGVLGLGLSWLLYGLPSEIPARLASRLGRLYRASYNKFYVDEIYETLVVKPTKAIAVVSRFIDVYFVDGLVRLTAWIPRLVGRDLLAPFQNGLIQFYAAVTALGLALLLLVLMLT